jgi:cell division septum initiation protein DivIVA
VDALNVQIAELNEQVKEVPLLQASLQKALKEANDADSKLQAAVNENEQIQEQVCPNIQVLNRKGENFPFS